MVAHCGPTLKGEFARSVNYTDMRIGWVFTTAVRNNAGVHILGACTRFFDAIPYEVTGMDFDNGSELINYGLIDWAAERKIFFTQRTTMRCANTDSTTATTPPGNWNS